MGHIFPFLDAMRKRQMKGHKHRRQTDPSLLLKPFPTRKCHSSASGRSSPVHWALACLLMMLLLSALGCLHSAARHPPETMTQACCPNMLPTCFCLSSVSVRTSSHVTWQVVAWKERDIGARSLCNPCPPHTNTDMLNKLHRLIPLCCANMHPLVDTLNNTGTFFMAFY